MSKRDKKIMVSRYLLYTLMSRGLFYRGYSYIGTSTFNDKTFYVYEGKEWIKANKLKID